MLLSVNDAAGLSDLARVLEGRAAKKIAAQADLPADMDNLLAIVPTRLWPPAISDNSIVRSEEDKRHRASAIIYQFLGGSVSGSRFLDYGCGEGHCVAEAGRKGAKAVGYDPFPQNWEQQKGVELTSSLDDVKAGSPYDTILLYDVLDHMEPETQIEQLRQIKTLLSADGKLYARCHPFSSAHGAHLYEKLNAAYIHLVFTQEDLTTLGLEIYPMTRVVRPIATYQKWFGDAGFQVERRDPVTVPPPPFFNDPYIVDTMIQNHWSEYESVRTREALHGVICIQFVDYVCSPPATKTSPLKV